MRGSMALMESLKCRRCRREISADDIHVDMRIAKCSSCKTVMDLATRGPMPVTPAARAPVPLPEKVVVRDEGGRMTIQWRWWSPKYLFLLFFCVFWDGFLLLWYGIAAASFFSGKGGGELIVMVLFPLLHVAAGVGMTYWVISGFLNSTTVQAGSGHLAVRHHPLPWPGKVDVQTQEIEQIFCLERKHRGKHGYSYTYEVHFADHMGKQRKLLTGLSKPEQALFLEQKLESFLGIADRPVDGELARRA